ncbi:MAG: hypothetical protein IT385_27630 [Deltaproteobacteria bacterium]|nr:hypothetical protein [Deltaproteobacteria bacterium]
MIHVLVALAVVGAPKPKAYHGSYTLDILGWNDGDPYRLRGAEAEAILSDPGAQLFQFQSADWMSKNQRGAFVKLQEVLGRFPERAPTELVKVLSFDIDGDRAPEALLIPTAFLADGQRFAPTLLRLGSEGPTALWAATELPGERYRVQDLRDLNADGRLELVLAGESGQSGFYRFFEILGHGPQGFQTLNVEHDDELHYVDLDQDDKIEIVVRERVGRKGASHQWTYVDHLQRWTGFRFENCEALYPLYHDEQTLPTLIGDLLDSHDARMAILEEKVAAIATVRQTTSTWSPVPKGFHTKKVQALQQLQRKKMKAARQKLEALVGAYPYDAQVLVALAQVGAATEDWDRVLDAATRALTVEPKHRDAWWWAGRAYAGLQERSFAVASMHLLVRLGATRDDGIDFLKARRGEPGMDADLQAIIDQALAEADKSR